MPVTWSCRKHRIKNGGQGLTPTEVDMIFIQSKERKGRRLDYIQFLTACDRMAQVKYPDDGTLLNDVTCILLVTNTHSLSLIVAPRR